MIQLIGCNSQQTAHIDMSVIPHKRIWVRTERYKCQRLVTDFLIGTSLSNTILGKRSHIILLFNQNDDLVPQHFSVSDMPLRDLLDFSEDYHFNELQQEIICHHIHKKVGGSKIIPKFSRS